MKKIIIAAVLLTAGLLFMQPALLHAAPVDGVREGVDIVGPGGDSTSVEEVVRLVINILSAVVGIIAVIMIIIGGLKYVMSSGDSNNINSAKNTILYAIIGLVVAAMAQVLVRFVLSKL